MKLAKLCFVVLALALLLPLNALATPRTYSLSGTWDTSACSGSLTGSTANATPGDDVTVTITNSSADTLTVTPTQDGTVLTAFSVPANGGSTNQVFSAVQSSLSLSAIGTCSSPTPATWSIAAKPVTYVTTTSSDSTPAASSSASTPAAPATSTPVTTPKTTTKTVKTAGKLAADSGGTTSTTEIIGTRNVSLQKQHMLVTGVAILAAVVLTALGLLFFLVIWPKLQARKSTRRW